MYDRINHEILKTYAQKQQWIFQPHPSNDFKMQSIAVLWIGRTFRDIIIGLTSRQEVESIRVHSQAGYCIQMGHHTVNHFTWEQQKEIEPGLSNIGFSILNLHQLINVSLNTSSHLVNLTLHLFLSLLIYQVFYSIINGY